MTKKATGRSPVDHGGAGRQEMWLALKAMPQAITVRALIDATGLARSSVQRYLKALTSAEYLRFREPEPGKAGVWELIKDVGHHAPRVREDGSKVTQGAVYEQLWRGMYMLQSFTFLDLIQHASIEIAESTARDYCKRLLAAGYLRVERKADPHRALIAKYRLIRNRGPQAPQIQRVPQVYDPNSREVFALGAVR